MNINTLFDRVDLIPVHHTAALVGIFLVVYVTQLYGRNAFGTPAHWGVTCLRRSGLIIIGLGLCWSLYYSNTHSWQPWPSDVLLIIGLDIAMGAQILAAGRYNRMLG